MKISRRKKPARNAGIVGAVEAKPPYLIMTMEEIRALPWNGYKVVSTFAGGGGSSIGYRMAGFRVAWANEFIEAAQKTYKSNKSPETVLDGRDIRRVKPEEILEQTGLSVGELDILDGSPPCASFSTAGKREKGWGKIRSYSDTCQRTDDLFNEFVRLLEGLKPKVFVAENVSGLVKGVAKGYFLEIIKALKACGYRVSAKVLDAQWLGVPQTRQRLIFVGVRNDLDKEPIHPSPLPYRYTVRDAFYPPLPDGEKVFCGGYSVGKLWRETPRGANHHKRFGLFRLSLNRPCATVTQTMGNDSGNVKFAASIMHSDECRYLTIPELKRICSFPDDYILTGTFAQQWERMGRAVPPVMMFHVAQEIRDKIL